MGVAEEKVERDFFISFAWEALPKAEELYVLLKSKGARAFFADKDLRQGVVWTDADLEVALGQALYSSGALVVLWGRAYSGSPWCRWEIDSFRRHHPNRPVFVLAIDGAELPSDLRTGIHCIESIEELEKVPEQFSAPVVTELRLDWPSSPWWASFLLLVHPRRWGRATELPSPNAAWLDLLAGSALGVTSNRWRWALSTLVGSILLNGCGFALAWWLCHLFIKQEELGALERELLFSSMISLVGGLVLSLGYGIGTGAAALVVSGWVGFGTTLVYKLMGGVGGIPAAATAGALIAATAVYRIHLSPLVGLETPKPPRMGLSAVGLFVMGLAVGTLLVEGGFSFRELLMSYMLRPPHRLPEWSQLPLAGRFLFGVGLGALVGIVSALSFRQRVAFLVRPRDERRRGWRLAMLSACFWMSLGGAIAVPGVGAGSVAEALVMGTLIGLVATSLYLAPIVPFGLRTTEGRKAIIGLGGAVFLLGVGRPHLQELSGLAQDGKLKSLLLIIGKSQQIEVMVSNLQLIEAFLWAGLVGTFGSLLVLVHRRAQVRRPVRAIVLSLFLHGLMGIILRSIADWQPSDAPVKVETAPLQVELLFPQERQRTSAIVPIAEQVSRPELPMLEATVSAPPEGLTEETAIRDENSAPLSGHVGVQDGEAVDGSEPVDDEVQSDAGEDDPIIEDGVAIEGVTAGSDGVSSPPGEGPIASDAELGTVPHEDGNDSEFGAMTARQEEAVSERQARQALRTEWALHSQGRPGITCKDGPCTNGKDFRLTLPPGFSMELKKRITASNGVRVELSAEKGRKSEFSSQWKDCIAGDCGAEHLEREQREGRELIIAIPTATKCRLQASEMNFTIECEDSTDGDWDEPRITGTFTDAWPEVIVK